MDQISFSEAEYATKRKQTRREKFLEEMDKAIPWKKLEGVIRPTYPAGGAGHPPYALSSMLRIYFMQQWYAMSDPGMEDALYEIQSMRRFAGLSLSRGSLPDETTILNFRRRLEKHQLGEKLFAEVKQHLDDHGLILKQGTIVDATIINAPSSTKNKQRQRDPDMHQTRKGKQWFFGMKAHIGVDANTGVIHSLITTPANRHDVTQAGELLHGDEEYVFGDSGYQGVDKREEHEDREVEWHIAMKPGQRKQLTDSEADRETEALEKVKASIRAKVEHPFRIIKRQFGFVKVRYKGLAKNTQQLYTLFALANLYQFRRKLA